MPTLRFTFRKSHITTQTPWVQYCWCLCLPLVNFCIQLYTFYAILLSCLYTRVTLSNQKVWHVFIKEGSMEDFHFVCNISVISTGLIWVYLWFGSSVKILDAYYTIMAVSLVHFGVVLLVQLKGPLSKSSTRSLVRLVSNPRFSMDEKPIISFLKKDNTGMFIYTGVLIDSRVSCFKVTLLVYYAALNLVEAVGPRSKRRSIISTGYFVLGILENVVLAIFWYESFKLLQINKAICYTLMYLLRLEELGPTRKSLKGLILVTKFLYKKFHRNELNQGPQTAEIRTTSLGFDRYSVISDAI
ncbi:hypothetical protein KGF57_000295 [Candida theae]|uniref:Uncharacterized protein n=1 Tax=Candida theae TaxID=1198502 RepID=A0AAD5BJ79_9ASCO|nr:uncharacterized protein KGF57_000295 [Candida theae]KAI5967778.1 hypothetical protein KGF57_000295 [Candida theae]